MASLLAPLWAQNMPDEERLRVPGVRVAGHRGAHPCMSVAASGALGIMGVTEVGKALGK